MSSIEVIRAFNRRVTERIGVLEDGYLARKRPLGASRVLWELDADGTDLRLIRQRLGLDSGYLSRLLRMLEREGLVSVTPDPRDGRVRIAAPTTAGFAERAELDRLSDALAAGILEPLSERQRTSLVDAMGTVERLLAAGAVEIVPEPPASDDARTAIAAYFAELNERFETGFDPALSLPGDLVDFSPPNGVLLLARLTGQVVGCGAVKIVDGIADIKRMWVHPDARGLGVGGRILAALEEHARAAGATTARLETNRTLVEAIALYRSRGYDEVPAFNDERYAHHWFEKRLDP